MRPDDDLCLCFHISWRKVINYIRINKVTVPSQVSQCGGVGTGCGWCRKQIAKLTAAVQELPPSAGEIDLWMSDHTPDKEVYRTGRNQYRDQSS
jgi:bacterioferritin-associated ferredoxin